MDRNEKLTFFRFPNFVFKQKLLSLNTFKKCILVHFSAESKISTFVYQQVSLCSFINGLNFIEFNWRQLTIIKFLMDIKYAFRKSIRRSRESITLHWSIWPFDFLMGEGFMGGCTPPLYDLFWFPTLFFKIWKRFFASVIKIISGIYG